MRGKAKCKILKEIRRRIANENEIPFVTRECTFQGACKGTCPKCEAELRYLEEQLEKRRRLGKLVTVSALSLSLAVGTTACEPLFGERVEPLEGDVPYVESGDDIVVFEGEPTEAPTETEDMLVGMVANTGGETEEPFILEGDVAYSGDPDIEDMVMGYILPSTDGNESGTESGESSEP